MNDTRKERPIVSGGTVVRRVPKRLKSMSARQFKKARRAVGNPAMMMLLRSIGAEMEKRRPDHVIGI